VRPSDLAAQMRLDLSTISRHLRSLEQQGMVQRTATPMTPARSRSAIHGASWHRSAQARDGHRHATISDAIAHWF